MWFVGLHMGGPQCPRGHVVVCAAPVLLLAGVWPQMATPLGALVFYARRLLFELFFVAAAFSPPRQSLVCGEGWEPAVIRLCVLCLLFCYLFPLSHSVGERMYGRSADRTCLSKRGPDGDSCFSGSCPSSLASPARVPWLGFVGPHGALLDVSRCDRRIRHSWGSGGWPDTCAKTWAFSCCQFAVVACTSRWVRPLIRRFLSQHGKRGVPRAAQ